ncbi:hypothetical protein V499_06724 [Pseudogymnoascus sp. VKM F-103]|uniref:Leucine rich repeat n=1 Tax=Pseudogymnoascus verrucosus TaxID=342668 RepID=A0A1B8GEN5_9PEZI|nr:leucine rich repeat [Pseudogymnoascus verrucosus]KFY73176.1 hypothetical protein V499_06724 [Pseudogymnoascus sp. VKM F-103]OBT94288.1 leucine rich repeat [Pseudogymnoascus verrucosus]
MESAWLDSLSEDWISQPNSEHSPAGSLPSLPGSTPPSSNSVQERPFASRIPVLKSLGQSSHDSSALPLSERSPNSYNVPIPHTSKQSSKLRNEISGAGQERRVSRTLSVSSSQSVQHHTVKHRSLSSSPQKSRNTPEWKKRLLHGDVAYGDQRDLFSPVGLENIFKPPPPTRQSSAKSLLELQSKSEDVTMRSSPPPYKPKVVPQPSERQGPKPISYKLADTGSDQFSECDLSQSSSFRPRNTVSRKASSRNPLVHDVALEEAVVEEESEAENDEIEDLELSKGMDSDSHLQVTPQKQDIDILSKRQPKSPLKDPTPKRRRTLHDSDIDNLSIDNVVYNSVLESHQNIQSIIGKKRKDARHGNDNESANPEVMATRQVLQPRTLSVSQRRNSSSEIDLNTVSRPPPWSQKELTEQQQKIARVQAELDMTRPTGPFVGINHHMSNDNRKPSVTTQDFLDEAKKIMAGIRGKSRPQSGLNSLEESESEISSLNEASENPDHEDSYQESTTEPFSRPPSREGGAPVPRQAKEQSDPELLSHLKKYEEWSDFDALVASSIPSTVPVKTNEDGAVKQDNNGDGVAAKATGWTLNHDMPYESDPPNIQITEYPELQRKRKHSTSSLPVGGDDGAVHSHGSNPSSGHSTNRSIHTGSSRNSDSRRIIAPHTVSHLIPEQLAGMVFDREKGIWVKRKATDPKILGNALPSDDDDPFGDIPDLTVDEIQEMQRIRAVTAKQREESRLSIVQEYQGQFNFSKGEGLGAHHVFGSAPTTSATKNSGSEPSLSAPPTSSGGIPDTQVTTWDEQPEASTKSDIEAIADTDPIGATREKTLKEVIEEDAEEEISINESRSQVWNDVKPRRSVTISFSSPFPSMLQDNSIEHPASRIFDHYHEEEQDVSINGRAEASKFQQRESTTQLRSSQRSAPRCSSFGAQNFTRRPVSRIDERDEDSFAEYMENGGARRNLSIAVTTPMPLRNTSRQISTVQQTPDIGIGHGSLYQLSPLSDFTMNHAEESFAFEVSYVAPVTRHQPGSKRSLSMTVKELVQRITDVEPYEPYWPHIRQIDLKKKKIHSLHMLSKFCGQLEELDVSDNEISQLDGTPETIRNLRITHNSLSDLTSWQHLKNLQYLDISNNDLATLEGLKDLVHLRAIRADNNKIESVNGIFGLDGLISLRLRNNVVHAADFTGCNLPRLMDLDLKGNKLKAIAGLEDLRSLATLHLEDNCLETFNEGSNHTYHGLKYLKLSGNNLQQIDVSHYPNIRLLYLDRNRLGKVTGLLKAKHIDSLSMREQRESVIDMSFLDQCFEVRKLFLSGNLLPNFAPRVDFLNLQYLELANCGLESLPAEFGQMMCNVRVLNLNFNALHDLKPLLGIVRLKRLHISGNRLTRLRKTTGVLSQFSSLSNVDIRNNPVTLGFYPPVTETRVALLQRAEEDAEVAVEDPFTLLDADETKDKAYAGRLDMETRMRRRVYEMLMVGGCQRLKMLDGLPANTEIANVKDVVWDELVKIGLVQNTVGQIEAPAAEMAPQTQDEELKGGDVDPVQDEVVEKKEEQVLEAKKEEERESQWPAEDSFA